MRAALIGARVTVLYLVGGLAVGFGLAFAMGGVAVHIAPMLKNVISGIVVLVVATLAGDRWGRALARATGDPVPARVGRVMGLVFGPLVILVGITLAALEAALVERGGAGLPVHELYTLLFVPATFVVVAVMAAVFLRPRWGAWRALVLALAVGGLAAAAFFFVDLGMDALGWRVGAPGAARRATMLVVTLVGCSAAALVGGAVLGRVIRPRR